MEKENFVQIINSRSLLPQPGKYQVKVTNVTPFERPDSGILTAIVNYAAMTPYQVTVAKERFKEAQALLAEGKTEEAAEMFQQASNTNLTSSQRIAIDFVPMKGEIVEVVLDIISTKNQDAALLVIGCQPLRTQSTTKVKFSLDELEDDETNRPAPVDPAHAGDINRERVISRATQKGATTIEKEPSLTEQPSGV